MKHIFCISSAVPMKAADAQDLICQVAHEVALVMEAKGGSLPFVGYLDAKCQIVPPVTQQ